MLKKRVIFTLLFSDGNFMLSRNFRLQKVGDIAWLKKNYNFSSVAAHIDELIILNVSRYQSGFNESFLEILQDISKECFVPIAAGGGVRDIEHARVLLRSGADKVVVNSILYTDALLLERLSKEFGQQCIVGSVDMKFNHINSKYQLFFNSGTIPSDYSFRELVQRIPSKSVGEWYLNSIDRDGTGNGYDFSILDEVPLDIAESLVLAGGAGNYNHFSIGLHHPIVSAVATANLFNFLGDGLSVSRVNLLREGHNLAHWLPFDLL